MQNLEEQFSIEALQLLSNFVKATNKCQNHHFRFMELCSPWWSWIIDLNWWNNKCPSRLLSFQTIQLVWLNSNWGAEINRIRPTHFYTKIMASILGFLAFDELNLPLLDLREIYRSSKSVNLGTKNVYAKLWFFQVFSEYKILDFQFIRWHAEFPRLKSNLLLQRHW